MSSLFSSPEVPKPAPAPEPLPPAPSRTDAETTALAEEQRRRYSPKGGRASTFLTQSGVTQGSSAVRFLGGAAAT